MLSLLGHSTMHATVTSLTRGRSDTQASSRVSLSAYCLARRDDSRWRPRTPAELLASQHYWRAKRWNDGKPNGYWTAAQWERLCALVGCRCAYCGKPTEQLSPDHIQPLKWGGTNDISNIAPVCIACQLKKGAKPIWEWFTPDKYHELMAWLHPAAA